MNPKKSTMNAQVTIRNSVLAVSGIVAIGAVSGWFWLRPRGLEDRVYRIGWMISPPFQVVGADGGASGISVDLVNLAARRRGIQLKWVQWNHSSESALISKCVDLWPLITITPERKKVLHISEPYLRHEHCLLVRDDAPFTKAHELATARIGMANPSIDTYNLRKVLPSAVPAPKPTPEAVVDDVCGRCYRCGFHGPVDGYRRTPQADWLRGAQLAMAAGTRGSVGTRGRFDVRDKSRRRRDSS